MKREAEILQMLEDIHRKLGEIQSELLTKIDTVTLMEKFEERRELLIRLL